MRKEVKYSSPLNEVLPTITIITVCLNSASSIESTIRSVLRQKEPYVEYLVIDGTSEDGTIEILGEYIGEIDLVISERDKGIYDAMNKGISLSHGEYLLFLNSGDLLADGSIKKMAELIKTGYDIYYGGYYNYKTVGNKELVFDGSRCSDISREIPTCHNAMVTARAAFENYGLYNTDYRLSADYEWLCRNRKNLNTNICNEQLVYVLLGGVSEARNLAVLREKAVIAKNFFGWNAYARQLFRLIQTFPLSVLKLILINTGLFNYYLYLKYLLTGVKGTPK